MVLDLNKLSSYHYELPEELIAQKPCEPRDAARLMVIDRKSGEISEMLFRDLTAWMQPQDSLVLNDTKVIPARLYGTRETGGRCEILLTRPAGDDLWEALARPGRKLKVGSKVTFSDALSCEVVEERSDGSKLLRFDYSGDFLEVLDAHGVMPLPPYIHREAEQLDKNDYQTVVAREPGAVAAPTAGLHFTEAMLDKLAAKGVVVDTVTLHVGPGTFLPVKEDDIRQHPMHSERYEISPEVAERLNARPADGKQICVGTTCCRTLEAASESGRLVAGRGDTDIFIYPGYRFRYVQHLLTNFHLPSSTLLMLVCAFTGYELAMEAYEKAVKEKFRFYSYGDAMLIL